MTALWKRQVRMQATLPIDAEESSCTEAVDARLQLNANVGVVGLTVLPWVVVVNGKRISLLVIKPQH